MYRKKAILLLIILTFSFMVRSEAQVALAIGADTYGDTHAGAITDSNDPSTYNIPVAAPTNGGSEAIGITSQMSESMKKLTTGQGFLANNISDFLISIINGIFNFMGLYSIDRLVEDTTGKFWGALSLSDVKVISSFVTAFTVIAWMIAGVSIQIFSLKLAASTTNARRRASVIDFFQNWFVGAVFLAVGPRAINMIFQAASAVIRALYLSMGSRPFNPITDVFTSAMNNSIVGLGTPIAIVVYLLVVTGITFMLNFIYLQRYVTLFVYAILSPVFMSFYFYDKTRALFWNWIKEIIGLAFMPAVHMLLMVIYMAIAGTGSANFMLRLVFLMMFIPLSDMIRKLTATSGGSSGVAENLLGGMGMGIAMQSVRTISGAAGAVTGGGMAEAALFGGAMGASGGGGKSGGGSGDTVGKPGGASGGSSGSGPAGFFGQGNSFGGVGMEEMMSAVNTAKGIGAKVGGLAGTIAGGLMGAGTGNMGGIMMGAAVGQKAGGGVGGKVAGKAQGALEYHYATHPRDENMNPIYEGLSNEERQERAFGPGVDAPSDMSTEMRQNIAARNMAMVKGQTKKANQFNAQINAELGGLSDAAHGMSFNENDTLVSMGYRDHTDYYKTTADGKQEWLYSSQKGDPKAGEGRAVRSTFSVGENRDFRETSRSMVNTGDIAGENGLPQGWNT